LARILDVEAELFAWRKPFEDVYHLSKGTVVKRIKPPFIPERKLYYRQEHRSQARMAPPPEVMSFPWNGKLGRPGMAWGPTVCSLRNLLVHRFELKAYEFDGPPGLLDLDLPGDWIVSADASREQLLNALAKIVQEDLGRAVRFELRQVERGVIVARGRYRFQPLSGTFDDRGVHVFGDKLDAVSRSGGGSGTFAEFLSRVGDRLQRRIMNETEGTENLTLSWFYHRSSRIRTMDAADRELAVDKALAKLSQQTSLTLTKERRLVDVWFVSDAGKESRTENNTGTEWNTAMYGTQRCADLPSARDVSFDGQRIVVIGDGLNPNDHRLEGWGP
jgi:hypothetical protein